MTKFLMALSLALSPLVAHGQVVGKVEDATVMPGRSGYTNYVINPTPMKTSKLGTAVSSATLTRSTSVKYEGVASFVCDTSTLGGYCEHLINLPKSEDQVGNCKADFNYVGDGTLYSFQLIDNGGKVTDVALINSTVMKPAELTYPCSVNAKSLRITQTTAGTSPAINYGLLNYSKYGGVQAVSQASLAGTLEYPNTTSCTWNSTSATYANYTAQTACSAPNVTGSLTAPATKVPGFDYPNMPPGNYLIVAQSVFFTGATAAAGCSWRLTDGTNNSSPTFAPASATSADGVSNVHTWTATYSTAANRSFIFQAMRSGGSANCGIDVSNSTILDTLRFAVYRYPTAAEMAIRPDVSGWLVDASIGTTNSTNFSLGVTNVTSPTQIASGSGSVIQNALSSLPVGAVCDTNVGAVGALTCTSGNEVIGLNFNKPDIGKFEVCTAFSHNTLVGTGAGLGAVFQIALMDSTTGTSISKVGEDKSGSYLAPASSTGTDFPHKNCSVFEGNPGLKVIKLLYTQSVVGTPGSSALISDRFAGLGSRDIHITVKPLTQGIPAPLLVGGVISSSSGTVRIETALITPVSASVCTVVQDGDWLGASTPVSNGDCSVAIKPGLWSAAPKCTFSTTDSSSPTSSILAGVRGSASTTTLTVKGNYLSSGSSTINVGLSPAAVICMGPK